MLRNVNNLLEGQGMSCETCKDYRFKYGMMLLIGAVFGVGISFGNIFFDRYKVVVNESENHTVMVDRLFGRSWVLLGDPKRTDAIYWKRLN